MAKTAMNQLEEQIEVIRREAYDAGYAAAMQALREFAGHSSDAAATAVVSRGRKAAKTVNPQPRRAAATASTPQPTTTTKVQSPTAPKSKAQSATAAKPKSTTVRKARAKAQPIRPQRGTNALLIAELLKGRSDSTRPADIRKALQRDKGVSVSFTSLRHALDQLAQRGEVEASADRKEWRYVGNGPA